MVAHLLFFSPQDIPMKVHQKVLQLQWDQAAETGKAGFFRKNPTKFG